MDILEQEERVNLYDELNEFLIRSSLFLLTLLALKRKILFLYRLHKQHTIDLP